MGGHAIGTAINKTNPIAQLSPYINDRIFILLRQFQLFLRHLMVRIYIISNLTDKHFHLMNEHQTDSRHYDVGSVQTVQTIDSRDAKVKNIVRFLAAVYFVGVAVDAEEVLVGGEIVKMVVYKLIDDCVHGVLFYFDLFVEIVVNVTLIGHRLPQVIVVSLYIKFPTLDRSR